MIISVIRYRNYIAFVPGFTLMLQNGSTSHIKTQNLLMFSLLVCWIRCVLEEHTGYVHPHKDSANLLEVPQIQQVCNNQGHTVQFEAIELPNSSLDP